MAPPKMETSGHDIVIALCAGGVLSGPSIFALRFAAGWLVLNTALACAMQTSRHFGSIDAAADYYEAKVPSDDGPVKLDLNVAKPVELGQAALDEVDRAIDDLGSFRSAALAAFTAMMEDGDGGEPQKFWEFHHEEVAAYANLKREDFVASLALKRAGFYPDGAFDSAAFLTLDFALGGPNTDQLLVADFLRDRSLHSVGWES